MWCGVGCRLYLRRARLLLEYGIVTKTLALALLAITTDGMGLVALERGCCQQVSRTSEVGLDDAK